MGLFNFMGGGAPGGGMGSIMDGSMSWKNGLALGLASLGDAFGDQNGQGSMKTIMGLMNMKNRAAQNPATDQPAMPSVMSMKPDASGNMPSLMALQQPQQPNLGLNLQGGFPGSGFGGLPNQTMGAFPTSFLQPRRY